jgi:hypothetical protein
MASRVWRDTFWLALAALALSGCGGGGGGERDRVEPHPDTTAPSVPTALVVTARSSTRIDLAWTASTDDVGVVSYVVSRDGVAAASASLTSWSDDGLPPSTQRCYSVRAVDAAGNASTDSAPACATTLPPPDVTPPSIVAAEPADHAENIAITTTIRVTFSEPLDPSSVATGALTLRSAAGADVAGTVAYDPVSLKATFTPAAQLAHLTIYTATVTGVRDVAGNVGPTQAWSFRTEVTPITFEPSTSVTLSFYSLNTWATGIAVADLDGDGSLDLALADRSIPGHVAVFLGDGHGTLTSFASVPVRDAPAGLVIADLDGDGKPDIAVTHDTVPYASPSPVSVLIGAGDGTFIPSFASTAGGEPFAIAAGDFNRDGLVDLVVANLTSYVSLLLGQGGGAVSPPVNFAADPSTSIVVGDFDEDGNLDVATGSGTLLLGDGAGSFLPGPSFTGGDIACADLNGDGHLDLVAARSGMIVTQLGDGRGNFTIADVVEVGNIVLKVQVADLNGDGIPDVLLSTMFNGGGANSLLALPGLGGGRFGPPTTLFGPGYGAIAPPIYAIGDLDGDGRPDIAFLDDDPFVYPPRIVTLRNTSGP